MIKTFPTVLFLMLLVSSGLSLAKESPNNVKIYSGYLHQTKVKNSSSLWGTLFGANTANKDEVDLNSLCSIVFVSPIPFSQEAVTVVPEKLSYMVKFTKNPQVSDGEDSLPKDFFTKYIVKVYSKDDQEYTITPDAQDADLDNDEEHHIADPYQIFLILSSSDIDHIEVISSSGDVKDKYVLDKVEVHNNL